MYYTPPYYPYRQQTSIRSILIITVMILVLLFGVYFYIKKKANDDLKDELPGEYADETFTVQEGKKIRNYALNIIEDIDGISISHNDDIYNAVLAENDRIFSGVAVDYKRLTGESLRAAIQGETSFNFNIHEMKIRDRMIARLNILSIF